MASAGGRADEVGEGDKAGGERRQEGEGSTGGSAPSGWALHPSYHKHLVASAWAGHRNSLLRGGRRAAWGAQKKESFRGGTNHLTGLHEQGRPWKRLLRLGWILIGCPRCSWGLSRQASKKVGGQLQPRDQPCGCWRTLQGKLRKCLR